MFFCIKKNVYANLIFMEGYQKFGACFRSIPPLQNITIMELKSNYDLFRMGFIAFLLDLI
jgi:hypothetical protein